MFSTCIVDVYRAEELNQRNLVPTIEDALDIAEIAAKKNLESEIYWAVSENRSEAFAGKFSTRSVGWSFPRGVLKPTDHAFNFSGQLTKKRMEFALTVLSDAQRQDDQLGNAVVMYRHSSNWQHYSTIPDEDFKWADAEIRARTSGNPPVPHPDPEVACLVWITYASNTLDEAKKKA